MKNYFDKGTPLTISMWDYSWLKCSHPGGAFHDLPRCVAEAAERGYNTLRIDAFPHFYVNPQTHFAAQGIKRRFRTWGDVLVPEGFSVDVRRKLIELADLCRRHKIWLALDTWMSFAVIGATLPKGGMIEPEQEEKVCRDWADSWVKALRLMREDGVLERAAWVAPLNEVPLFLGAMMRSVKVSDPEVRHEGQTHFHADLPELDALFQRVNTWLGEAVKAEISRDRIPLAYSALGAENYASRLTDLYDVADVHFMPDVLLSEEDKLALEKAGKGASKFSLHDAIDAYDLALYSAAWDRALRRNYEAMLGLAHDYAREALARTRLPSGKLLATVLTEPYGPCNYPDHPEVSWDAYKDWNADAARIFASYDYAGLSLSNHAEPLFSLWQDAEWQRRGNLYIRRAMGRKLC